MIRTSIRRPVAIAMTYASVAALGLFAWRNIPLELLPNINLPRITASASWSGASPETVEAFLTSPMEAEIQQVQGVEKVISTSEEGSASISIEFNRDVDMDFARLDLVERLTRLQEDLPSTVGRIAVQPYVPTEFEDQRIPLLIYTFTGPYTQEALYLHLDEVVIPELTQIEGVAIANSSGARRRLLEIRVEEDQIAALGLNPSSIARSIRELNLVQEAGVLREGDREWTVTIVNRPESSEDIRNAILTTANGTIVRVKDVATVHDTFEEATRYARINREPALTLTVVKERGANSVKVADEVKARLGELARLSPFGSEFILVSDESEQIRAQLSDLRTRALISVVVIFLVLLLFLRSFRSAGLVFATIAFSVLIALNLIYFGGMSLNILTLMGLAMGFGLVVDNSIVVLENVYRRWQGGEDAPSAAENGAREVVLPIMASTATTLIVFVPFVYLQGDLRVFYMPLAIVVGLTLLASLFVAFSFIPGLSARLLSLGGAKRRSYSVSAAAFAEAGLGGGTGGGGGSRGGGMGLPSGYEPEDSGRAPIYVRFYQAMVGFTLRHPWTTVTVTLFCLGGSWYLFDRHVDRGRIWGGGGTGRSYINITISLPRGASLDRTNQLTEFFEERLEVIDEIEQFETNVYTQRSTIRVLFPEELEFTSVPVAIKDQMFAYSLTFTGADVRVTGFGPSFYGGGSSAPNYSITVLGYNYERVREIAEDLGSRLTRISRVQDVNTNSAGRYNRDRAVEYVVRLDRDALARNDLTVQEVVNGVRAFIGGTGSAATIKIGGDELRYQVKASEAEDIDVLALREAIIPIPGGRGIRLGDVVTIQPEEVLSSIRRENQQYQRVVAYEFRGPRKLGDLYRDQIVATTVLPPGYTIQDDRYVWDQQRDQIFFVLALSIMLVYMVTASLFESLRQPLCVLLTVPMALIGVFMIFFYAEATFTREAYIGVIMMGGIVVNSAILLVDHINRFRRQGDLTLEQAILRGTLERVRPILMTTTTTVLGLAPLVLFSATADANIWNALGFALIGGLLSSTLFVLTTTPALYYLFEQPKAAREAWVAAHLERAAPMPIPPGTPLEETGPGSRGSGPAPQPA